MWTPRPCTRAIGVILEHCYEEWELTGRQWNYISDVEDRITRFEFYNEPRNPRYAFGGLSPNHPNGALARSGQTLKRAVFQFEARVRVGFETYIFGIRGRCSWGSSIYLNPRVAKGILESVGYASSHELYPDIVNKCISARFQLCVIPVSCFHFPHKSPDLPASAGIGYRFCTLVV